MLRLGIVNILFLLSVQAPAQARRSIDSFRVRKEFKVTIDRPVPFHPNQTSIVVFFALPNGNSTEQTMGKKMQPGDDWHFDIQHIAAQTLFIREQIKPKQLVVVYLENVFKSWPSWKQQHPEYREILPKLVDSLALLAGGKKHKIYLNGHSGGGSFIFGYLAGLKKIPRRVERISFIDSNYGYDSSYYPLLQHWLQSNRKATLTVFAYNDSVALYNNKPVVSATGGTWYRSWLMLQHLSRHWSMDYRWGDSIHRVYSKRKNIQFCFKLNLNRGIYHTQQVEYNGFIHSILAGTRQEKLHYQYYGKRAYDAYIR